MTIPPNRQHHFSRAREQCERPQYAADALGSILMVTDATQATVTNYSYDAYGATTQTGMNDNGQQYTGAPARWCVDFRLRKADSDQCSYVGVIRIAIFLVLRAHESFESLEGG